MKRTSMRVPIPAEMRETLAKDKAMHNCLMGLDCEGKVEWNHGFTYGGKRVNELWAISPLCQKHHKEEARHRDAIRSFMRGQIKFYKARKDFDAKYPRSDLYLSEPPAKIVEG